jgi:hypothetical protein
MRAALLAVAFLFATSASAAAAAITCDDVPAGEAKQCALDDYQRKLAAGTAAGGTTPLQTQPRHLGRGSSVVAAAAAPPAGPATVNKTAVNFQGCAAPGAEQYAFCDPALSTEARVEDLLNRFSLDQKLGMLSPNPTLGSTCQGYTWNGTSLGDAPFLQQVIIPVVVDDTIVDHEPLPFLLQIHGGQL